MSRLRGVMQLVLALTVLAVSAVLAPAPAMASELGDFLWERRPLLVFAPTAVDPRLAETLGRIEAGRCDFVDRDMVLGVVVARGDSTLDGQAMNADEARHLIDRFAIGPDAFATVLVGKDGGEKLRVDEVPDMRAIYDLIDGMPMRDREASARPGRC